MRTLFVAIPVALVLATAAPAHADGQQHVQAARKAERRGDWSKALKEWKAAYSQDINAEYLIGVGDAEAHLGNTAEAKKNYEAYLADPLALPANVSKVKAKLASLDAPAGGLALPGAGGLELPGAAPAGGLALPGAEPAGLALPGGDAPGLPIASDSKGKKGKKGKKGGEAVAAAPGLDLPLPGAAPGGEPQLPGLELPGATKAPAPEKKVALASPGLDLPPLPGAKAEPPKTVAKAEPPKAVAKAEPVVSKEPAKQPVKLAAAPTTQAPEKKKVPDNVLAQPRPASPEATSGSSKTLAYVAAGVALVGLGGGAFMYTKAGAVHDDLASTLHDRATAQQLLKDEASHKTLSFIGFAAGLAAAGVATALFAF